MSSTARSKSSTGSWTGITRCWKCAACHAVGPFDQKIVGPGLKGVLHDPKHPKLVNGDDATPANVAAILQKGFTGPMGVMPNQTANALSDKDIANLVAFLDSLK